MKTTKQYTLKSVLEMKDLYYVERRLGGFGQYYLNLYNERSWIIGSTKDYDEKRIDNFIKKYNLREF